MGRFKNVLIDLDGTVSDPYKGIAESIRHAMLCMGRESPAESMLRLAIGPPLRQSFAALLATNDANQVEEALRFYRERYSTVGLFENAVYAGVPDLLAQLKQEGCRLFIATSKPLIFAQRIVEHFGLVQFFDGVYGAELDGTRDNKGDLLGYILDVESLTAGDTAMIGDRSHDMVAARAHNICSVGVTWGYGSREELRDAGADVLFDSPAEVFCFLTGSSCAETEIGGKNAL